MKKQIGKCYMYTGKEFPVEKVLLVKYVEGCPVAARSNGEQWVLLDSELAEIVEDYGMLLPTDAKERKQIPIVSGVIDYFPLAIAEVAKCSLASNEQHNPGQPLHWDRTKSTDHIDCIGRHIVDRGKFDNDGQRHSAKLAWRALALLQLELEAEKDKQ